MTSAEREPSSGRHLTLAITRGGIAEAQPFPLADALQPAAGKAEHADRASVVTYDQQGVYIGLESGAILRRGFFNQDQVTATYPALDRVPITALATAQNNSVIVGGTDGTVRRLQLGPSRLPTVDWAGEPAIVLVFAGDDALVTSAHFNPSGKRMVTASEDKTARLWEAASGKELAVLRGHEGVVSARCSRPMARGC